MNTKNRQIHFTVIWISLLTISNITSVAKEEIYKWHDKPFKKQYSVLYINVPSIRVKRDIVESKAVYFIISIDEKGDRIVLYIYIDYRETSGMWEDISNGLINRGIKEILLGVMNGLLRIE
ncbi:MAG: hypothetical protein GX490_07810 [Bacilli bacterium]|nr:hypothetical protein [Bacilli bacterium]